MTDVAALLERLIRVDTHNPGGHEGTLASLLAGELEARRPDDVELVQVPRPPEHGAADGAYVIARWGRPRLLLNAHIDTVPPNAGWSHDPYTPWRADGRLYGLGACDTKGAIAAILAALDAAPARDLAVVFSGDEELGGSCAQALLGRERPRALGAVERAVVCEPTSCRAGTRHRGVLSIEARLDGQGGHSSRADTLPAPLAELARLAVAWADWGIAARGRGPEGFRGMCFNVAQLDGGVAFNVVPERARLCVSLRPPPGDDLGAIEAELRALAARVVPAAKLTTTLANPAFATRALAAFSTALGTAQPIDLAFWTEAALFSRAGIDCVVFGPGDIAQAHAPDEFVPLADLDRARDVFVTLLTEHAEGAGGA